jgi:hypothetical protein
MVAGVASVVTSLALQKYGSSARQDDKSQPPAPAAAKKRAT